MVDFPVAQGGDGMVYLVKGGVDPGIILINGVEKCLLFMLTIADFFAKL